jgi:hypothetical protein
MVARNASKAMASLSGTQYQVGSVGSTVCKYSLSLLVTREHLERILEAGEEPQDSLFLCCNLFLLLVIG